MNRYYDRQGNLIDLLTWGRQFQDHEYQIIARHEDNRVLISTVWLGLDHNYGAGPPLIFETMVFIHGDIDPRYNDLVWRWSTEEEAKNAHDIIVNCYRENKDPEQAITQWQ